MIWVEKALTEYILSWLEKYVHIKWDKNEPGAFSLSIVKFSVLSRSSGINSWQIYPAGVNKQPLHWPLTQPPPPPPITTIPHPPTPYSSPTISHPRSPPDQKDQRMEALVKCSNHAAFNVTRYNVVKQLKRHLMNKKTLESIHHCGTKASPIAGDSVLISGYPCFHYI